MNEYIFKMENKCLECYLTHIFNFSIENMKKILLINYNKDKYENPFKSNMNYNLPDTLSTIINIDNVVVNKLITFNDNKIEIVSNKTIQILNNPVIIKFKIIYIDDDDDVNIFCKVKVDIQFLPQILISLIRPMFDYVVENIFNKEREIEQEIYNNYSEE